MTAENETRDIGDRLLDRARSIEADRQRKYYEGPTRLHTEYAWRGDGPPPAYWYAADGTKVYRSYEDYCDD